METAAPHAPLPLDADALVRVLRSLTASVLGRDAAEAASWNAETRLDERGLALDSIQRLELAGRVNELLHLHETGVEDYLLTLPTLGEWVALVRRAWPQGPPRLTFTTSGTTGTPQPCRHEAAALAQEVDALADLFADRRRVMALAPPHHIYGFLFTVLLPARLGVPLFDGEADGPFAAARALRPGDLVVTFPLRWTALARAVPQWPDDVEGVTSTGPCPPGLVDRLGRAGLARMTEVYGASETAGIGVRRDPAAPYRLLPYWTRTSEEPPRLMRRLPDGSRAEPVAPMDHLRWHDARRFEPVGRRDGRVQVAGVNVDPAAVAAVLRTHPDVADCAVRPMRPDEGERLKAFVVPVADAETGALREALPSWCREHLDAPRRPAALAFGPEIPRTAAGKPADW